MLDEGVRCFELDLLPSADGDVMMVHNSVIDGKNVWELSAKDLEKQGCAKLTDLLDMVEEFQCKTGERVRLLLEVKGSVSTEEITDASEDVTEISADMIGEIVHTINERTKKDVWEYDQLSLIGFNHGMLKMAKEMDPGIQIGLSYAINPDDRLMSPQMVGAAHAQGLKVQSWTDGTMRERPDEMIRMGVDTLITDRPVFSRSRLEVLSCIGTGHSQQMGR
jgi:glycerophosphoryl diester phosphodiesterase